MSLFELERLRREGKEIILPGGKRAIDVETEKAVKEAEKRIDKHWNRVKLDELLEFEDEHNQTPPVLLGC